MAQEIDRLFRNACFDDCSRRDLALRRNTKNRCARHTAMPCQSRNRDEPWNFEMHSVWDCCQRDNDCPRFWPRVPLSAAGAELYLYPQSFSGVSGRVQEGHLQPLLANRARPHKWPNRDPATVENSAAAKTRIGVQRGAAPRSEKRAKCPATSQSAKGFSRCARRNRAGDAATLRRRGKCKKIPSTGHIACRLRWVDAARRSLALLILRITFSDRIPPMPHLPLQCKPTINKEIEGNTSEKKRHRSQM